jgi:pimeloyl-ACP methyl ester carboxylesterase
LYSRGCFDLRRRAGLVRLLAAIGASAGLIGAAACAAVPEPPPPFVREQRCQVTAPGVEMSCGVLVARLDRRDGASDETIRLSYAILRSRSASPARDPIVFLTGGPGSSAFYFLNVLAQSPSLAQRDLIVIEQRGNGYSEPNLVCDVGDPETEAAANEAIRECYTQLRGRGRNLDAYTITESANDLADLRVALGVAEWNVAGTSFGSFWALRYAQLHSEGIRSLVLDSPVPAQSDPADSEIAHINAFSRIFSACAADAACARAYPNLRDRFVTMVQRLDRTPLAGRTGPVTGRDAFSLIHGVNFETSTVAYAPRLIDAIDRGDLDTAREIASLDPYGRPRGMNMGKASSVGLLVNMQCASDLSFSGDPAGFRLARDEQWPQDLIDAAAFSSFRTEACGGFWGVTPDDIAVSQPISSDIPALIVVGAFDPETPPELGVEMARTLPNATVVVLPDASHAALSSPSACAMRILAAFLDAPSGTHDTSCAALDQPRFSLPGERIAPTPRGRAP